LTKWQDCIFFLFIYFSLLVLMNISSMEADHVVHDATKVVGNNGISSTMTELHEVLKNIEQILARFKCYIEAYEACMAQTLRMAQAPPIAQTCPMVQAFPVAQTTHANIPTGNAKEPKFIMPEKFDGT
jgi:hypothetical protein